VSGRRWSAVIDNKMKDAATSSVLTQWTGEAVVARRTCSPVQTFDGTGLSIAGVTDLRITAGGHRASAMADQFQGTGVVVLGDNAVPGIPPRWRPVRC
jgi:hypothetical protein